jgi:hypothetical protein
VGRGPGRRGAGEPRHAFAEGSRSELIDGHAKLRVGVVDERADPVEIVARDRDRVEDLDADR